MVSTAKQGYFDKVYHNAKIVKCACGCGTEIKSKDKYGRDKKFVNGHNNRKYSDPRQYKREWNKRNKEKRLAKKQERGRRLKAKLIQHKGNQCESCGLKYNGKNASVFQFHHINPSEKIYAITVRTLVNYSWDKMLFESEKCKLLCANCHFLHHSAEY